LNLKYPLEGLDKDRQQTLLNQLRDLWTHASTAFEGNTLTLVDTKFILEEGLTVSGRPIEDHKEVIGHANEIELLYQCIGRVIAETDQFNLHRAVQGYLLKRADILNLLTINRLQILNMRQTGLRLLLLSLTKNG